MNERVLVIGATRGTGLARHRMLTVSAALGLLASACGVAPSPAASGASPAAPDSTTIVVAAPTFVAFFPPVTEEETAADEELNTTLDDFGWHLSAAMPSLRAQGYVVEARFADTLHFRGGTERWRFVPPDSGRIGYYLVAPGRAPEVRYQVHVDAQLVELGAWYLRGAPDRHKDQ